MTIQIAGTDFVEVPCSGHAHVVQRTHLTLNEGDMDLLRQILDGAARSYDFAKNGDLRTFAGSMYNELGFGDDPSLWPAGRPE